MLAWIGRRRGVGSTVVTHTAPGCSCAVGSHRDVVPSSLNEWSAEQSPCGGGGFPHESPRLPRLPRRVSSGRDLVRQEGRGTHVSTDTKAIIGTIIGTGVVLAGLLFTYMNSRFDDVNARIRDVQASVGDVQAAVARVDDRLNDRIDQIHDDMREDRAAFDDRLRAVELAFGKVDQRLLTIERAILPAGAPGEQLGSAALRESARTGRQPFGGFQSPTGGC